MNGFTDRTPACEVVPAGPGVRTASWSRPLVLAAGFVLCLLGPTLAAQQEPASGATPAKAEDEATFQVVIHAGNPTVEMTAAKIKRMFRKKVRRWDHDVRALPIDLDARSPIRKDFTRSVHGTSVTAIKSLWIRMIFSGTDEPPEEMASEMEALSYVRTHPGAIAYVAAETALPDGVKKLKITP